MSFVEKTKRDNLDELINKPTKAEERPLKSSFSTQDPNQAKDQSRQAKSEIRAKIHS